MNKYEYIFFDLDGTIFDSGRGIMRSVRYALEKFGIDEKNEDKLKLFIGPPLRDSFRDFYGFSDDEADKGVVFYREYYTRDGIFDGDIYSGIEEMLKRLTEQGGKAVLATSKPEVFAKRIIAHFGLEGYFTHIAGASLDKSLLTKTEVIAGAVKSLEICDRSKILMIGDRKFDIEGAADNGIDSAGVLYGYGSEDELRKAGADYIAADVDALMDIISL
ncbi:MAG: HAD hydrolase-like protein [Oscillospiraceae bacterium]|nr:HAD hydrolase-like protein [Oscillospiraceae bacterium]